MHYVLLLLADPAIEAVIRPVNADISDQYGRSNIQCFNVSPFLKNCCRQKCNINHKFEICLMIRLGILFRIQIFDFKK